MRNGELVMGLHFSHCEAYWVYSAFNRFRARLAAEVGIALHCMESFAWDFSKNKPCEKVKITMFDENDVSEVKALIGIQPVIKWESVKDDIVPLLNHSDCDGELTVEECKQVVPRLRELVAAWEDDDKDKIKALELAEGMELAIERNEPLEFR